MNIHLAMSRGRPKPGHIKNRGARRRVTAVFGASALAFAGLALVAPAAQAVHELNLVEMDGNAVTDNSAYDDWDSVCKAVTITNDSTASIPDQCVNAGSLLSSNTAVAWANDGAQNASIFTGGGSKDPNSLTQWQWKDQLGGLPDKDNLQDAFAARYSIPKDAIKCKAPAAATNCEVLFFGSDRFDNSGDAQQGFWFFQNKVTLDSATGKFNGVHKNGDLLILSDFSNGGQVSTINIYKWVGTDATGGLQFVTGGDASKCGVTASDAFCGIVNPDNNTTSPWTFKDKSGNSSYLNGEFYEGGVNLSDPTINLGGECFSSFTAETRSSTSTTATLKDFVLGQFALCSATLSTTPSAGLTEATAVAPGTSVTDLATVTGSGTSSPPTPTGTVEFFLCGPNTSLTLCTASGTGSGTSIGTKTLAGANGVATATSDPVNTSANPLLPGYYCFRATYGGDTNYTDALNHVGTAAGSECFLVRTIPTTTVTTPTDSSGTAIPNPTTDGVALGTSLYDKAVVTGTTIGGTPTGSVNFFVCNPNQLTNGVCAAGAGSAVTGNPKTLSAVANSNPPAASALSGAVTANIAGVWCFRANYVPTGSVYDPSNDTGSTTECVKVNPASTTTVTTPQVSGSPISGDVAVGTSVTDHAVVTGNAAGGSPTGTVDFYVCSPSQLDNSGLCSTGGTSAGAGKALTAGTGDTATADSDAVVANVVGTWCFRAEYKSDTVNYTDSSDSRANECFTVKDTTSATSEQNWLPNDSATITSTGGTALNGTLSFTLYDSADCTGTVLRAAESFTLTDAASPVTKTTTNTDTKVSTSKTVSWKVVFSSSTTLVGSSNHCEKTQLVITN